MSIFLKIVGVLILGVIVVDIYHATRKQVNPEYDKNSKSLSKFKPFSFVIDKELELRRDAFLGVNDKQGSEAEYWMRAEKQGSWGGNYEHSSWISIPKGSKIRFSEATFSSNLNGVSISPHLIGEIFVTQLNKTVEFKFNWGEHHLSVWEKGPEKKAISGPYRTYELAPWQYTKLKGKWPSDPRDEKSEKQ